MIIRWTLPALAPLDKYRIETQFASSWQFAICMQAAAWGSRCLCASCARTRWAFDGPFVCSLGGAGGGGGQDFIRTHLGRRIEIENWISFWPKTLRDYISPRNEKAKPKINTSSHLFLLHLFLCCAISVGPHRTWSPFEKVIALSLIWGSHRLWTLQVSLFLGDQVNHVAALKYWFYQQQKSDASSKWPSS